MITLLIMYFPPPYYYSLCLRGIYSHQHPVHEQIPTSNFGGPRFKSRPGSCPEVSRGFPQYFLTNTGAVP